MILSSSNQFGSLSDLRIYVKIEVPELQGTLGYIESGHGAKGKLRELHDDQDVTEMYMLHKRKADVLLWLYGSVEGETPADEVIQSRKRPRTEKSATTSKRESIAKTINTVEAIVTKLKEKHGENGYPVEQFHCWAHMINSGKYSSYDKPPNFPFFNKAKAKEKPRERRYSH